MSDLLELCEEHIKRSGATLWGRSWSVLEDKSRKEASRWLAEQIRGVYSGTLPEAVNIAEVDRYRRKWLAERRKVQRLSLQVRELKASLLRLLAPDLDLRDDPPKDALGQEKGCTKDAEQDDQSDEAEDEVHGSHGTSGPMTPEWPTGDNVLLVGAGPRR